MKPFALDPSMTSAAGTFYPTGYVFALFADEAAARSAGQALQAQGRDDVAHALVSGDERRLRLDRPIPFGRMQVGVADAGGGDLDENLAGSRCRHRRFLDDERFSKLPDHRSLHCPGHAVLLHHGYAGRRKSSAALSKFVWRRALDLRS